MPRQLVLTASVLLVLLLTGTAALAAKPTSNGHPGGGHGGGSTPTPTPGSGQPTICLDAGHGGSDPGAVYGGMREADLTLEIAVKLRDELLANSYAVVMTRDPNNDLGPTESLSNTDRANICNSGNANAVLAIHLNASTDSNVDYFQAFWGKKNKDLGFAQTITSNYAIPAVDGSGQLTNNPVGQFASGVLLKSNAPASLVETVFLSNPNEWPGLEDGSREQQIADALYLGLMTWVTGS